MDALIDPTAIVEAGAQLGDGVRIWHWVHVMPGAVIGARTSIGQGCFIGNVTIGSGCKVQNHVSLFDGVTLGDDVFLGPSCVFTNVKHPRAHVSRKDSYGRTLVCRGASIGANATIICGVTIGEYAMIGAGAVVLEDVHPHAIVAGTPARRIGWACRCGETLPRDLVCQRCNDHFAPDDDGGITRDRDSAVTTIEVPTDDNNV